MKNWMVYLLIVNIFRNFHGHVAYIGIVMGSKRINNIVADPKELRTEARKNHTIAAFQWNVTL